MENNRAVKLLDKAAKGKHGIAAMCCYNLEGVFATIQAAERKNSPAMVLLFPWAMTYAGDVLVRAAGEACRAAKVPVTLHLDHCQTPEMVRRAADIPGGFDSIMVDMSHYDKEENLRLTHELTEYCHQRGIATEAEPGRIEGGEDGVSDTIDLEGVLTTPEEARLFVDTGIDWLAPAFGNVHGNYGPRGIQLEYDRLEGINKEVGKEVRLVLHGADSFTKEIYEKCIGHGVSKVNINKFMNNEYLEVQRKGLKTITSVIEEGTQAMQAAVESCIDMLGSAGKA